MPVYSTHACMFHYSLRLQGRGGWLDRERGKTELVKEKELPATPAIAAEPTLKCVRHGPTQITTAREFIRTQAAAAAAFRLWKMKT